MKRRDFLALLGGATGWALGAEAPQADTIKRVGLLRVGPAPKEWIESFRQGLRDHGLVEGQGYSVELGLADRAAQRSEEHTSELQSPCNLVCRLLLEKKKKQKDNTRSSAE